MRASRRFFPSAIALLAFIAPVIMPKTASADVVTFSVSGTFANGASFLPGSFVTVDTVAGTTSSSDLLVSAGSGSPANTFTTANINQNGAFQTPFDWVLPDGTELTMFAGPTEFQGFPSTGGPVGLVTYFGPWGFSGGSFNTVLTPAAVPEPSAIWLLGSGLPSLIGVASLRRFFHRTRRTPKPR
jgi:hypothetical protein